MAAAGCGSVARSLQGAAACVRRRRPHAGNGQSKTSYDYGNDCDLRAGLSLHRPRTPAEDRQGGHGARHVRRAVDAVRPAGRRRRPGRRAGRTSGLDVRDSRLSDRGHGDRGADRRLRRLRGRHTPHRRARQATAPVAAGARRLFHVGRAGQHDHRDRHGHPAACARSRPRRTLALRLGDRHRGQQRRRLVAHRRRDDHHALDERQRDGMASDAESAPALPRLYGHTRTAGLARSAGHFSRPGCCCGRARRKTDRDGGCPDAPQRAHLCRRKRQEPGPRQGGRRGTCGGGSCSAA